MEKGKYQRSWQEYIMKRNTYVKIHREEKKNYKKGIIENQNCFTVM